MNIIDQICFMVVGGCLFFVFQCLFVSLRDHYRTKNRLRRERKRRERRLMLRLDDLEFKITLFLAEGIEEKSAKKIISLQEKKRRQLNKIKHMSKK